MKTFPVTIRYPEETQNEHGVVFFDPLRLLAVAYAKVRGGSLSVKPRWHHKFKSLDRLNSYSAEWLTGLDSVRAMKLATKKEAANDARKLADAVYIGQIFSCSWGYEQTNVDFYEVTAKTGLTVTVRAVCSRLDPNEGGHPDSGYSSPVPGLYKADEQPMKRRVNAHGFKPASYSLATPWDGRPRYTSWYH